MPLDSNVNIINKYGYINKYKSYYIVHLIINIIWTLYTIKIT